MNMQFVRTSDIQRNFKAILQKLHASQDPVVVLRDSVPEAVMLTYSDYQQLLLTNTQTLKSRMEEVWNHMRKHNAHISDTQLDADIEKAKRYAKRSR